MNKIVNLLKEPSTYAGLSALTVIGGLSLDTFNLYVAAISGLFAFVAILMKEGKSNDKEITTFTY